MGCQFTHGFDYALVADLKPGSEVVDGQDSGVVLSKCRILNVSPSWRGPGGVDPVAAIFR